MMNFERIANAMKPIKVISLENEGVWAPYEVYAKAKDGHRFCIGSIKYFAVAAGTAKYYNEGGLKDVSIRYNGPLGPVEMRYGK